MPGTMSIGGLMSGLKTDEIIAKVMEYARRPQTRLQEQKAENQLRLAAWQDINTRVLALRTRSESIADLIDFQAMSATSSDSDILTASASTSAAPGTYYFKVTSRAQSHQVSSQAGAYASVNDVVGTGTVHLALANGTDFDVTLDSANNTLGGLRDAINKAYKGVQATIINAGTSDSPDYRLLLTSAESGAENRMTVIDTSGLSGGTAPAFGHVSSQAAGYTSTDDVVGTGTVHFQRQNGTSFDITLDSGNNTLSGLRDAINNAGQSLQATIKNAGTSASPDYRLEITSTLGGTENQLTEIDTSELSGGTAPTFDEDIPVQTAADATIELGQGAGKITVTKNTNTITDLIPGVTLNLLSADASTTVRVDVVRDASAVRKGIEDFVQQYNDLSDAVDDQFEYDTQSGETLPLFGDYQLQNVQSDIIGTLTGRVRGLTSSLNALATIGITQDTTGQLNIDSSMLTSALEDNMAQVGRIFGAGIDSDSSYVSFLASTADTKPSGLKGWQVEITQAARRAQVTAGTEMSDPLSASETLTVNGKAITLDASMDIDDVIDRVNSYSSQTNVMALKTGADGTGTGNYLTFRRAQYGDAYEVTVISNLSRSAPGATGVGNVAVTSADPGGEDELGQGMVGLDVAGTINGQAASGNGQLLTLNSRSITNDAKGLSLLITATGPLSGVKVVFTKGVGAALRELLAGMTSTTGTITDAENSINTAITQIDSEIAEWETRLTDQEARLYTQFNALEVQLARLQQQGQYLAAQFSAMNKSR